MFCHRGRHIPPPTLPYTDLSIMAMSSIAYSPLSFKQLLLMTAYEGKAAMEITHVFSVDLVQDLVKCTLWQHCCIDIEHNHTACVAHHVVCVFFENLHVYKISPFCLLLLFLWQNLLCFASIDFTFCFSLTLSLSLSLSLSSPSLSSFLPFLTNFAPLLFCSYQ